MTLLGYSPRRCGALVALVWLAGCSDGSGPVCCDPPPLEGLMVSNPIASAALTAETGGALALVPGALDDVTYVSLAPGTVPTGRRASVRRVGDAGSVTTAVTDGGFDPLPIAGQAGDSVEVVVTNDDGAVVLHEYALVAASRRPIIVRTDPPPRKRDVPLNASVVIVFSEPMNAGTLTSSSVQLLHGTTPVAGTVSLLQGSGVKAAFTPDASLAPMTDYTLIVTTGLRDLDGSALEADATVPFTTGQSSTGPAASITLSPDSEIVIGATPYQITATVRDAAGNELIDQPITWSVSVDTLGTSASGLTVSPTGLLTSVTEGWYLVKAESGGFWATVGVVVDFGSPATSVVIAPSPATVGAGDTIILTPTIRDAAGRLLSRSVVWASSAPAVATVALYGSSAYGSPLSLGLVTGVSPGTVAITATSGAASGTVSVTVNPPQPVASVTLAPKSASLVVQGQSQLRATLRDVSGRLLSGRLITWTSDNGSVAIVNQSGLVTGVGLGLALVSATSEGQSDAAALTVTQLSFGSVSAGVAHTCGVTTGGTAYCWGSNQDGMLGDGSTTTRTVPVAVTGGLTFSAISAGVDQTCGLTAGGAAYCWGHGSLGNDSTLSSWLPVAVSGGWSFSALSASGNRTCGVATNGTAYCWGNVPVVVTGGLTFSAVTAGNRHTCGLTTPGIAYCWGNNDYGQLGDGTIGFGYAPVPVSGGLTFSALSAGDENTCGLTTTGIAYCWGSNSSGQLGVGSTTSRSLIPVAVAGGLTFSALGPGANRTNRNLGSHTCGVTTAGAAYCWGSNNSGQLGDGSTTARAVPVAVTGGLTFSALSASLDHTCGLTTNGAAYCWGSNASGQLGTGTTTSSSVPVKVAGQP